MLQTWPTIATGIIFIAVVVWIDISSRRMGRKPPFSRLFAFAGVAFWVVVLVIQIINIAKR